MAADDCPRDVVVEVDDTVLFAALVLGGGLGVIAPNAATATGRGAGAAATVEAVPLEVLGSC